MRAIVHSIHSQVPGTIAKLDRRYEVIVSLDSHLDISLGGDDRIYPKQLRMIVRRTGAHTAIRQILGERPPSKSRLTIAIPERMLARHAEDIELNLPHNLRVDDAQESISSIVGFLGRSRGIDIFQSPPQNLLDLLGPVKKARRWLLDIDVDYMEEMQKECYTRIINPEPGVLQSMSSVIDFVSLSKPKIITLSEAKLSAIRDTGSAFSTFVAKLKGLGYVIEEGDLVAEDATVVKGISICKEFYRTISKSLMTTYLDDMMEGDFGGFRRAEERAAREFFKQKGYVD